MKIFAFFLIIFAVIAPGIAQEATVSIETQVPLLLKALNYDEDLGSRLQKKCNVVVLYNPNNDQSVEEKNQIVKSLKANDNIKVHDKKIEIMELPLDMTIDLEKKTFLNKYNVFFLTAGLDSYMNKIRETAKFNRVITMSTNPEYVKTGQVALGVVDNAGTAQLVIHQQEAQNVKAHFGANLLKMAMLLK